MNRWIGLLNLLQALVFGLLAAKLGARWMPAGAICGVAVLAQLAAGGWLLAGRDDLRPIRWANGLTLVVSAFTLGLFVQVGVHIVAHFTPVGAQTGYELLGGTALAAPWVLAVPLGQLIAAGIRPAEGAGTAAAVLLAVAIPSGVAVWHAQPIRTFASDIDVPAAARWTHNRTAGRGEMWLLPEGPGPVLLIVSLVDNAKVIGSEVVEGETLEGALSKVSLETRNHDAAVYVDAAVAEYSLWQPWLVNGRGWLMRPAESALLGTERAVGSLELWRSKAVGHAYAFDRLGYISIDPSAFAKAGPTSWVQVQGGMGLGRDAWPITQTWSSPPELTADTAYQAAVAGARHMAYNQADGGRYAYVVKGPSGHHGGGYNYPRHAGATWFLARVARRTDEDRIWDAARKGLDFLGDATEFRGDVAYVLDPGRRDGRAWVGTTALAVLGSLTMDERQDLTDKWVAWIASAVDERGVVRGDFDRDTGEWPEQAEVTYAQGQGMLALAVALRSGHEEARAPLERAAAYVESGDYWPRGAGSLFTMDEHWMCLAALVAEEQLQKPAGRWLCEAYLDHVGWMTPVQGGPVHMNSGALGGLGEAVIARAEMDRLDGVEGRYHQTAKRYGEVFLRSLYRRSDRSMVGRRQILGGFRETPWGLDVRVDAVQHIGCALLGIEQLLRGQKVPGGMP